VYTYSELLEFIKEMTNLDIGDVNVPKPIASLMAKVMNVLPWQTLGADEIERVSPLPFRRFMEKWGRVNAK